MSLIRYINDIFEIIKLNNREEIHITNISKEYCKNEFSADKLKILMVSDYTNNWDNYTPINAIIECIKAGFAIDLDIYGQGYNSKKIQNLIQKAGNENIQFKGQLKNYTNIYKNYDLFITASNTSNIQMNIIEVLQIGLPLLITDTQGNGQSEFINNNGFLLPENNIELYIKTLKYFFENKSQLEIMGQNSRKLFEKKYKTKNFKQEEINYKFSVLMPVYKKDNAEYFATAFDSIIKQTLLPNEILIIEDGKLDEDLENLIIDIARKHSDIVRVLRLEKNIGIGRVRALSMEECKYDYVAFMDSDDISRNDRFEKQINYLKEHSDIDVLGAYITEFKEKPENICSKRILPTNNKDIYKYGKFRMPVNNPTIMLKRQSVLDAGNYKLFNAFEDYELYARMLKLGYKFANIPEFLVNMRAGREMMDRRKGIHYFLACELPCMNAMKDSGYINLPEYIRNITLKLLLRVIPNWFRNWIYKKFLRA